MTASTATAAPPPPAIASGRATSGLATSGAARVVIVGRPNVGKSTLFNRLTGRRQALVVDAPGTTRDALDGTFFGAQRALTLVDTGGIDAAATDPLRAAIRAQAEAALGAARVALLVVDGRAGLLPADSAVARGLHRRGIPTAVLVNKADVPGCDALMADFYRLGFATVLPISAEHGRGMDALHAFVDAAVAAAGGAPEAAAAGPHVDRQAWAERPIRVAVVGRPNAGKSSLINCILGSPRHLATPVAGTTSDPIDSAWRAHGHDFTFIDTAGIRRRRSVEGRLEKLCVSAAFASLDRCDVAVLVLDGTERPSDQDTRIAAMAVDKGKALVLALNKWDLIENPQWRERYLEAVRLQLPFAPYAPLLPLSARTGRKVDILLRAVIDAQAQRHRRIGTGELNRLLAEAVAAHPPAMRAGKRPQLYFVSQPLVAPPTFVFATNRIDAWHFSYRRYLVNALRDRYGFAATPIWLKFRAR